MSTCLYVKSIPYFMTTIISSNGDRSDQKMCDDCTYVFADNHVFKCEYCKTVDTCIDCVGTMHKVGGGHYDTLCKKCWQKCSDLIEQEIAKNSGK